MFLELTLVGRWNMWLKIISQKHVEVYYMIGPEPCNIKMKALS